MSSPRRSTEATTEASNTNGNEAGPSHTNGSSDSSAPAGPSDTAQDQPSSSNDSPSTAEASTTLPQPAQGGLPRIQWTGRVPSFFIMGPNGSLMPQFVPTPPQTTPPPGQMPGAPAPGSPSDRDQTPIPSSGAHPGTAHLPPPRPNIIPPGVPPFFPFFFPHIFGSRERRPDPEAAAELLRSLPTVEKGLFKRVERVLVAEQVQDGEEGEDRGWKCGICLEGVEEEAKETGVKVLPCNHLFHGDCLEPWLTTNHTCPTCRLDLDPLKTLRRNPTRASGRPAATGSGRQSPHPYARGGDTANATADAEANGDSDGPNITFFWHIPAPPAPVPAPAGDSPQPAAEQLAPATPPTAPAPNTPMMSFGFPFHASPLPMRAASPGAGAAVEGAGENTRPTPESAQTPTEGAQRDTNNNAAPLPQPRNHVTIIHHHHPSPHVHSPQAPHMPFPAVHIMPLPPPQVHPQPSGSPHPPSTHHHHHHHPLHHHHHIRPTGSGTPDPAPGTPASSVEPAQAIAEPEPGIAPPLADPAETLENDTPTSPHPPANEQANEHGNSTTGGGNNRPHFHFFFNISDGPPPGTPPMAQAANTPTVDTAPAISPALPVERPSLESWVIGREKALGWRCDAPECGVAPTEEDDDIFMLFQGDKDMLSIYSPLQPAVRHVDDEDKKGFELHACEHRWHRTCLESTERCAGRIMRKDSEGRVWVRCETCRKDGWVWPRERSSSEGEVERLCEAN